MSKLAARFSRHSNVLRANSPLSDDQIKAVAPSIYAEEKHASRSARYAYIPTGIVLAGLKKEGFYPFMVCQSKSRDQGKREHTKHMIRLRHAGTIADSAAKEIILVNSHDGTSSYQMLAGMFRFACQNGLVVGNEVADIRIPHRGNIVDDVIEGAFTVLEDFAAADNSVKVMKASRLSDGAQRAFAKAALSLRYDNEEKAAPVTETQILSIHRHEDAGNDMWSTFNRVQENMVKGGLRGRSEKGKIVTTRPINGIDSNVKLNRALWILATEMEALKNK
jgi:hypothetical protein